MYIPGDIHILCVPVPGLVFTYIFKHTFWATWHTFLPTGAVARLDFTKIDKDGERRRERERGREGQFWERERDSGLQPLFSPSVGLLWQCIATTILSYGFPIFETSATTLCGTYWHILYIYIYQVSVFKLVQGTRAWILVPGSSRFLQRPRKVKTSSTPKVQRGVGRGFDCKPWSDLSRLGWWCVFCLENFDYIYDHHHQQLQHDIFNEQHRQQLQHDIVNKQHRQQL